MCSERQSETSRVKGAKSRGPKTPRRLRGDNILNENRILQNEPESRDLTALNSTPDAKKISTEPKAPQIRRQFTPWAPRPQFGVARMKAGIA